MKERAFNYLRKNTEDEISNIENEREKLLKNIEEFNTEHEKLKKVDESNKEIKEFKFCACEEKEKCFKDREKFLQLLDGVNSVCYKTINKTMNNESGSEEMVCKIQF